MVTSEERMRILRMVEEGKLSPEEATRLLSALQQRPAAKGGKTREASGRWLRVRVYDRSGKAKLNVNLPLRLVDVGLGMAERLLPEEEMASVFNLLREALAEGMTGKIVDVVDEEEGERVEVFIE